MVRHEPEPRRHDSGGDGADQNPGAVAASHEHGSQQGAAAGNQRRRMVQVAQRDERPRRRAHHAGPLEADQCDQQTDAGGDRMLEGIGNHLDQTLAQADQ